MAVTPRPKTRAAAPKGKARNGQGTIAPRDTKTKGRVYDAWCTVRDLQTGLPRRESKGGFPTEAAAQAWIDKTMGLSRAQGVVREKSLTVPQIVDRWLAETGHGKAGSTMMGYGNSLRLHIRPLLNIRVETLNGSRMRKFINDVAACSKGPGTRDGRATAHTAYRLTRAALNWAALPEVALVQRNPLDGFRFEFTTKQRIALHIPDDNVHRILAAAEGKPSQLVWQTLLATGARRGEILGLNVSDLDLQSSPPVISISKISTPESTGKLLSPRTKGKASRTVSLRPAIAEALAELAEGRHAGEPLFLGPRGGRLIFDTFRDWWDRDLEAAGLAKRYTPHQLRHTFATKALAKGQTTKVVSEILGHSDPATTMRVYVHVTDEQKHAAIDAVGSSFDLPVAGNRAGKSTIQPSDPLDSGEAAD